MMYRGKITKVNSQGRHGWIGRKTVTDMEGGNVELATGKDIFLHSEECRDELRVGLEVKFEVDVDRNRTAAYRAICASAHMAEPPQIELHVDGAPIDNPTIPVAWCFTREMHERMLAGLQQGYGYAVVLLVRQQDDYYNYREYREIKSADQAFSFVTVTKPGAWDIGIVLYELPSLKPGVSTCNSLMRGLTSTLLSKSRKTARGNYEYIFPALCPGEPVKRLLKNHEVNVGHSVPAQPITFNEISVTVASDIFAPEPSERLKAYGNYFFKFSSMDECDLRRRLMLMFSVGWVPWLVIEFWNHLLQLLGALFQCSLMLKGSFSNLKHTLSPAIKFQKRLSLPEVDQLCEETWDSFYPPFHTRHSWFLNPLFLAIGAFVLFILYKAGMVLYGVGVTVTGNPPPTFGVVGAAALIAGVWFLIRYKSDAAKIRRRKRKEEAFLRSCRAQEESGRKLSLALAQQEAERAKRNASVLVCGEAPRHVSIDALPPELRTFSMKFIAIKRTICRPFA